MYKGAKYTGVEPVRIDGRIINPDTVLSNVPEWEAKDKAYFEPVYEQEYKKKYKKIDTEENNELSSK